VEFPGALYHVTSRGNERKRIYRETHDRILFLDLFGVTIDRFGWLCHGYCLMGNHYHLIVETPEANLAAGMQQLNSRYAQSFNRRWGRVGHLFQGRYKAVLVEKDAYLLTLARYVALNPVRVGWRERPEHWRWSGYRALVGLEARPPWLSTDWILGQFARERPRARARLREFVADGIAHPEPLPVRADLYLATDTFLVEKLGVCAPTTEIPRAQRQPVRPTLDQLFSTTSEPSREAYERWGYTLREIGDYLGRHYSTISRRLSRSAHAA
jgi:putative transposase